MKYLLIISVGLFSLNVFSLGVKQKSALEYAKKVNVEILANSNIIKAIESRNTSYKGVKREGTAIPSQLVGLEASWRAHAKQLKLWRKSGEKRGKAAPTAPADVAAILGAPCSVELKKITAKHEKTFEVFIMDNLGANVCTNILTGDYDQGDEDKWQKVFVDGKPEHVGKPKIDHSSRKYQTQVSLPIVNSGGKMIGVVTIGVQK